MRVVLPGKPESQLQAVAVGLWESRRIIAYITGNAVAILSDATTLVQTIYGIDSDALQAIAFDEASGALAVCTAKAARLYRPAIEPDDKIKWTLDATITFGDRSSRELDRGTTPAPCLSWGRSGELLVARSALDLYQTSPTKPERIWHKELASQARFASLSYDSAFLASVGAHDGLVKLWRRLSYGSDDVRFDFAYLRHPRPVTSLQWRKPHHVDETMDNVLFTICADNVLRIWAGSDPHNQPHLQLWGKLDLLSALPKPTTGLRKADVGDSLRLAILIQERDFGAAVEAAVREGASRKPGSDAAVALQHMITIANYSPDVCMVFDGHGRMSAWALENIGSKPAKASDIFNIMHTESSNLALFASDEVQDKVLPHLEAYSYCNKPDGQVGLLLHWLRGQIDIFENNVAELLDPQGGDGRRRLRHVSTWSGHSAAIRKMVRNFSGSAVVSRTGEDELAVWKHDLHKRNAALLPQGVVIQSEQHIHRICVLRKGRFVVFLGSQTLSVWDCRSSRPLLLSQVDYSLPGKPLCLLILPRATPEDVLTAYVATITSAKKGMVWQLKLPDYASARQHTSQNGRQPHLREFCRFDFEDGGDLAYALPVDPAGAPPRVTGFLDVFARDVAVSYTHGGKVEFWTARIDQEQDRVEWLSTASMETGIVEPALVSGSMLKKTALVSSSRTSVSIWDVRAAQLEFSWDFGDDSPVQDLDWTATPDSQSILAVGFPHRVVLLSQMRFDYLNQGPAWAAVREINMSPLTPHPIGDSTWLGDGDLVIGAGNQLFVHDRHFDVSSSLVASLRLPPRRAGQWDLFDVVRRLNGPLAVFHPQFLSQCVLAGKSHLVRLILEALHQTLKYHVEGEDVDEYLGLDMEDFYLYKTSQSELVADTDPYLARRQSSDEGASRFSEEMAQDIGARLTKVALPQLSGHEQIQLLDVVECAGLVEKQRRSMDENAARYMVFYRQNVLREVRAGNADMSWREINWAFHSTSQDILTDFVTRQHQHGTLLWENARQSGMFMWLSDNAAVKRQFELVARNAYAQSEPKDPVACSLFYLALKKKTVLQGLWRMATWSREQVATQKLLSNNFEDARWRTAALKNAYALMSKRRFEYAAAFFLLADHLQDAVNVCMGPMGDMQLAIAIARVYEGDNGPVLRRLLEEEILAVAAQEGNRWLASWAFWMLRRKDMAVRALITPVYTLMETPASPDMKSRLFLTDDPALVILYAQLRQKTLQTLRGASKVTPKAEWEFVLHSARLYDRMGCDLLALDLVRNWEFLRAEPSALPTLGGQLNPLNLMRRRTSLIVDDLSTSPVAENVKHSLDMKNPTAKGAPPPAFVEPDANSLLDSFGF